MRQLTTIFSFVLLITLSVGCEKEHSNIVLFTGSTPIYQTDTCHNLISSVTLYLTDSAGITLGIDEGNDKYTITIDNPSIVKATFTDDVIEGYKRLHLTPLSEGVTYITVHDSDGNYAMLNVTVKPTYSIILHVTEQGFGSSGTDIPDNVWIKIQKQMEQQLTMKAGGRYELFPTDPNNVFEAGTLHIYPTENSQAPIIGTYKREEQEDIVGFCFYYNGKTHRLTPRSPLNVVSKMTPVAPILMWEEMTESVQVPQGCQVYYAERWIYEIDT